MKEMCVGVCVFELMNHHKRAFNVSGLLLTIICDIQNKYPLHQLGTRKHTTDTVSG